MTKQKSGVNKWWILLLLAAFVAGGFYYAKQAGYIMQPEVLKVSTELAKHRTIVETVSANGKVYPETEVKITPDVSGEIVALPVEEGDSVVAGQRLVRINPDIYASMVDRADAAVNSAKANLSNTKARILQIQSQLENSRRTHERNEQLFADQVIAQAELESSETALRSLEAEIKAAEQTQEAAQYNVQSAEATLKEARDNLNKTSIYAPVSGIVSQINNKKGERVVGTSQMPGTEIMRIANFNEMEVQADVSENDVIKIAVGDTAIVEVDAYDDRTFLGEVMQIANSATLESQLGTDQVTNFTVKIRLLRSSYADLYKVQRFPFRPGMTASVEIITRKAENVIAVPTQAVTSREIPDSLLTGAADQKDFKEVVFVYSNGKVSEQTVKVGIQDKRYSEIKQGLQAEAEVVSAPYNLITKTLRNGTEVVKVSKDELYKKEEQP